MTIGKHSFRTGSIDRFHKLKDETVAGAEMDSPAAEKKSSTNPKQNKQRIFPMTQPPRDASKEAETTETHHRRHKRRETSVYRRLIDPDCYFRDGVRVIDFILAYQPASLADKGNEDHHKSKQHHAHYRDLFEKILRSCGLETEHELASEATDRRTCYLKIHAPWDFLASKAELLEMNMPIRANDIELKPYNSFLAKWFFHFIKSKNPFYLAAEEEAREPDYFTAKFDRGNLMMFLVADTTKAYFFTPIQRIRLVDYTLRHIKLPPIEDEASRLKKLINMMKPAAKKHSEAALPTSTPTTQNVIESPGVIDLFWLLQHKVFIAAYPLHDSDYVYKTGNPFSAILSPKILAVIKVCLASNLQKAVPYRQWLKAHWATFRLWYKYQPLHHVRAYLGERYALYFAWIGHYNQCLIVPALLSIVCIIYGISTFHANKIEREIQSHTECPFEEMSLFYARLAHIFENESSLLFAVILSVWSLVLQQTWLRRQNSLSTVWGTSDNEKLVVSFRPQFLQKVKTSRYNPITKKHEPHIPLPEQLKRRSISAASALFFCCLSLACVIGVIVYRLIIREVTARASQIRLRIFQRNLPIVAMVTASVLNSAVILTLKAVYREVAWLITEYECPKTQKQFETSFTYKVVSFQFVNYFGSIFYIAFVKPLHSGTQNAQQAPEVCPSTDSLAEVCIQLIVLMTVVPMLQNVWEYWFPILKIWWRRRKDKRTKVGLTFCRRKKLLRWEQDRQLNQQHTLDLLFDEYLELTIQYGMITMFASAFPLGVLFALFNNIFEMRIDANKYVALYRRPVPVHDKDLGPWLHILKIITNVAVVTNGLLITFTSDIIDRFISYETEEDFFAHNSTSFPAHFNITKLEHCIEEEFNETALSTEQRNILRHIVHSNYWQRIAIRLVCFILFEHFILLAQAVIRWCMSDTPRHAKLHRSREEYLRRQALNWHHVTQSNAMRQTKDEAPPAPRGGCDCAAGIARSEEMLASGDASGERVKNSGKREKGWDLLKRRNPGNLRQVVEIAEAINISRM